MIFITLKSCYRFHCFSRFPNLAAPFSFQGHPTPDNSRRWLSSARRVYSLCTTPWPPGCIRCTCTGRTPRHQWQQESPSAPRCSPCPLSPLPESHCRAVAHHAHQCPFPRHPGPELPIQWRGRRQTPNRKACAARRLLGFVVLAPEPSPKASPAGTTTPSRQCQPLPAPFPRPTCPPRVRAGRPLRAAGAAAHAP